MPATWTGGGNDGLWSTAANWDNNDVPDTAGETAVFGDTNPGTVVVNGNFTIDALTFNNTAGGWLLNGNGTLTIVNGGTLNQSGAGTNQIASQLLATGLNATISAGSLELSNTTVGAANNIDGASVFHITGGGRLIGTAASDVNGQRNPLGTATIQFDTSAGGVFEVRAKAVAGFVDFLNPINALQSGTIDLSNSAATGDFDMSRDMQIAANQTLTFHVTQREMHVHATISGAGNVLKTGASSLIFDHNNTYTGTTTVREGRLAAGQTVFPVPLGSTAGATIVESGATLAIRASTNYTQPEPLFLSGTGANGAGALSTQGGTNTFAGPITLEGDSSITAQSGESLTVTGAITTSGGAHDLSVGARVTLKGTLAVGMLTVAGGTIDGNSTGTTLLTASDGASFDAASSFVVDLNGLTAGSGYDRLDVTGAVQLNGRLNVRAGFTPPVGSRFTIVNNDGTDAVTGAFLGLTEGAVFAANGVSFRISYVGGTGNDVVLTVVPAEALAIRGVQRGTVSMGGTTEVVTLATAVDPRRAFVVASFRDNDSSPALLPTVELTGNGTTLTITRSQTTSNEDVAWQVVEFTTGVRVQRGLATLTAADLSANVAIGPVDLSKAFVLTSVRTDITAAIDRINDERWTIMAQLAAGGNLALSRYEAGSPTTVAWQVIEFTDPAVSVQSGVTTLSDLSATATIADLAGPEFLVFSSKTQPSASAPGVESNYATRGRITLPTELTFDRQADDGNDVEVSWFVVSLPGAVVQSGDASLPDGTPTGDPLRNDVTILPVDVNRSFSLLSTRLTENGDDRKLDEASVSMLLVDADTLRLQRAGGASVAGVEISWFVVEFNAAPSDVTWSFNPQPVDEGSPTTLSGSFKDADAADTHTITIDWGDGSADTVLNLVAGDLTFGASHTYQDGAAPFTAYPITVTVMDSRQATVIATSDARPLDATGYNRDVVIEQGSVHAASSFDAGTSVWFESGAVDGGGTAQPNGLPLGGSFTSATGSGAVYQLQSFTGANALYLNDGSPTGSLVLSDPAAFRRLSILAASADLLDYANPGAAAFTLHFSDSTTYTGNYFAPDWYVSGSPRAALPDAVSRGVLNSPDTFGLDSGNGNHFQLFETTLDLEALGLSGKVLQSITFDKVALSGIETGIFAVSGSTQPAAQVANVAPTPAAPSIVPGGVLVEGVNASFVVSGTFSDPAGDKDQTYEVVVDWGDGNTTTFGSSVTATSYSDSLNHTYTLGGTYDVTVSVTDKDGGTGTSSAFQISVNIDPPTVLAIDRTGNETTSADVVRYLVTFSENVTGVDVSDFRLTTSGGIVGAQILSVSGSGSVYTVTVSTGTGSGTLGLEMAVVATANDSVGNDLVPSTAAAVYLVDRSEVPPDQVDPPTPPPPVNPPSGGGGETLPETPPPPTGGGSDGETPQTEPEGAGGSGGTDAPTEPVGSNVPDAIPQPAEAIPVKPRVEATTEPRGGTTTPTKPVKPTNSQTATAQAGTRFDFSFLRQELGDEHSGGGGGMSGVNGAVEITTGVTVASLVLTVGYLALFGRNAILVWTVMVNLPMWRELDPLAFLEFWEKKGRGARAEQEVGELFDG